MAEIFVLIEHRKGEIRDISYELLTCGRKLADDGKVTAVILGTELDGMVGNIKSHADRILVFENELFQNYNSETYQMVLADLIQKENPFLFLIGHTAFGWDLCPSLATQLKIPFTTDCLDVEIDGSKLKVIRNMFDGKLNAKVTLRENPSYMITMRAGSIPAVEGNLSAETVKMDSPISEAPDYRKFVEYIEAVAGDVDITKSDIVIGIGRGIKEQENLEMIEDFANAIGGVVACSRPIVDADWLPKDRQVGSSGKVIKPKLYIAIGISGAFQHVAGMKGAEMIVAINKDANAPIFHEADYGIVDDLFKVIPVLKEKILEIK
jgi:electron transfer flavoprotein alpha subunit